MKIKSIKGNIVLLIVIVVFLTTNLVMTSISLSRPMVQTQCPVRQKTLPCESVPLDWAVNNPDCANRLFLAMNVTNVKFQAKNSTSALVEKVRVQLQNSSYRD